MPGLIDLHVHFREPGFEHKETIRTGARAAARGGFTTVCVMPNTKPVVDSVEMVKYVIDKAKEVTDIHVLPIAAITAGQDGEFITDFEICTKRCGCGQRRRQVCYECESGKTGNASGCGSWNPCICTLRR